MSEKKTVYSRRAHSVCRLTYHAVFVVKYRRKVISPGIMDFFKVHTKYLIEERFRGNLIEFNGGGGPCPYPVWAASLRSTLHGHMQSEDTAFQGSKKAVSRADPREIMERLFLEWQLFSGNDWRGWYWNPGKIYPDTGDQKTTQSEIWPSEMSRTVKWERIHPHPTNVGWGFLLYIR